MWPSCVTNSNLQTLRMPFAGSRHGQNFNQTTHPKSQDIASGFANARTIGSSGTNGDMRTETRPTWTSGFTAGIFRARRSQATRLLIRAT